jgi:ribosome-binding factor A
MSKIRQKRTADQIQLILSELCLRALRDPRLHDMTITDVVVDRELQHANIYVNALGDESRRHDILAALHKANGFLRHELAGRLRIRGVPELHFHWDSTLAQSDRVNQILDHLDIPPSDDESNQPTIL